MKYLLIFFLCIAVSSCTSTTESRITPSESQAIQSLLDGSEMYDVIKEHTFQFYEEQLDLNNVSEILFGTIDHVEERVIPSGKVKDTFYLVYDYTLDNSDVIDWIRKEEKTGEARISIIYGHVDLTEEKKYIYHGLSPAIVEGKIILAFKDKAGYALAEYIEVSDHRDGIFLLPYKNIFPERQIPEKYEKSISAEEYYGMMRDYLN